MHQIKNNTAILTKLLKNSNSFALKSKVRKFGMQNKLISSILQNMKPLSIVLKNMENKVTCRKDSEVAEIPKYNVFSVSSPLALCTA